MSEARKKGDWHEDDGFVLWWKFPIDELPYVGTPLCDDWPGYHTHWTPIDVPGEPTVFDTKRADGEIK